ncbi:hypothetical protein I4U23_016813 [Adineta vaga]|nr:hypothetical protein I4U23_016813 [Adineta vaga]
MFRYVRKHILFQTICDGFVELAPILIGEQNHTDETECEQWQCNNIYTHCDGLWNCRNGADEIGCNSFPLLNCSPNDHICVSPHTNKFMCLPITKANDGNIDCVGASDETLLCQRMLYELHNRNNFHCIKGNSGYCIAFFDLCDGYQDCIDGSDEQFCEKNRTYQEFGDAICQPSVLPFASDVEQFICNRMKTFVKQHLIYFSLDRMHKKIEDKSKNIENSILLNPIMNKMSQQIQHNCNRGVDLRVWSNNENNSTRITCLCPPSYYGDKCQYQNERISLTLQVRVLSDSWQIPFSIIILLIDNTDQRIIHSYEQLNYLSVKHCKMKYNIYLTYSTRPKDFKKNYSIHIDIYERISLTYRGSYLFPIYFPFLPVHRLALIVDIPQKDDKNIQTCSNNQCNHGKCIKYLNNAENITYCKCDREWFGKYCNIQQFCQCSNDSLCIGVLPNNRSICICPIDKFGSRCLLPSSICQNSTCQNDGQCIPNDNHMIHNHMIVCICSKGFIGDRCEAVDNKLILSFEKNIIRTQSIFIHFVEVVKNNIPNRATTFKMIPIRQDSIIIYWSQPFHLVFIELFEKNYYLVVHETIYNQSTTIVKMINPSDHCQHISKIFNESFAKLDLIRRIKYYHLICELYSSNLKCFYDNIYLCLCYDFNQKRLANCFEFDHNMTFDCLEQSVCENDGQCFQDHPNCPHKSICICPLCYYGTRCQFSTSGFDLSLDAILGYHILPNISIIHQPVIIKISLALTTIFISVGVGE